MEIKCPTCGLERTVDAVLGEHAEEQMCEPCAASYKALLAEIEVRAAQRMADNATAVGAEASAPLVLMAPASDADPEARPGGLEAGACDAQEESDSDGYALGVSLYRVPAAGLAVSAACLFAVLFFAGWLRPAGAAQPASVLESAAAAQSSGVQVAGDKIGDDSTSAPADAELPPAAEVNADVPAAVDAATDEVAADEASAEEASAEEISEAQFEKEELAAAAGAEPEGASAPEAEKGAGADGRFTVQVSSHNKPGEAEARASALRAAGFDARVAAVEIPKKGTWYRVQAGRFQTREQAAVYEKSLRAAGAAETTFVAESTN